MLARKEEAVSLPDSKATVDAAWIRKVIEKRLLQEEYLRKEYVCASEEFVHWAELWLRHWGPPARVTCSSCSTWEGRDAEDVGG